MKRGRLTFVIALIAVVAAGFFYNFTRAEEKPGQAMTVSPLIIEKQANAGETISFEITVRNDLASPLKFKNYINDFETSDAADEQGVPKIIFDDREPHKNSIRPFVAAAPEFVLSGKQSKKLTYKATIPADTPAGGYYGSIRFTGQPEDTTQQVDLSGSIGNLLFIQVGGAEARETMQLTDFFTSDTNYNRAWFFWSAPVQLNEWVKNDGNTFLRPKGRVEIYNIFGAKIGETSINEQQGNEKPKLVLPGSTRKFHQLYESPWMIGPYTAKLLLFYGNAQSTTVDKQITFWVIPWWLILLIIAVIVLIILLRKGLKRYKQSIIRKANKRK